MDIGPGIEGWRYVEGKDCGDETYCGCEEMDHADLLLGFVECICSYKGSVLADVHSCSGPAAGQERLGITKEESV